MIKKIVGNIQNFMYNIGSKYFGKEKNKILMIGSYQKFGSIIKELKKNKNNIVIRGSTTVGRSLFRKDVDYFITFENSEDHIKKILRNINFVVTTNDIIPFEKNVIKIAHDMKINSLIVQHGYPTNLSIFQSIPITSTKIALWGELTKNFLIKGGAEKEKMVITGSPQFDDYVLRKPDKKENTLDKYNIPYSKNIILFTAQPLRYEVGIGHDRLTLDEHKEIFHNLFEVAKELNYFLIIKLHPSNEPSYSDILDLISAKNYDNYIILKHEQADLFDLIDICDVSITYNSTTAIESMILKKPVITVNFSGRKDSINYAQYDCAINVTTKDMLKKSILDLINDKLIRDKLMIKANRFLKYSFYNLDGLSSQRVANLITSMINKN